MSTAEVGQPSLVTHSPHQRLTAPASHRTSHAPVINVDDDDSIPIESYISPRSTQSGQSSLPIAMDEEPRAARQSVAGADSFRDTPAGGRTRTQEYRPNSNGAQNRPIVVLDSDEEQGPPAESSSASHAHRWGGVRRRGGGSSYAPFRIFSPPPPQPQHHPVPPVPPIIAEPMPFTLLPQPINSNQPRIRLPFDEPARPANNGDDNGGNGNRNGIQLGGGLLYQRNNPGHPHGPRAQVHFRRSESYDELFDEGDEVDETDEADEADDAPGLNRAANFFGRFFSSVLSGDDRRDAIRLQRIPVDFRTLEFGRPQTILFGGLGQWGRRDAAPGPPGPSPDYDSRMTHPERAAPGWTYDFGTEEEEGDSKVDGSEILVCAKCLDPLLANADGMVDVSSEEEKKGRRVWGLRCGHVLDGKCVDHLMQPVREKGPGNNDITRHDNPKAKGAGELDGDKTEAGGSVTALDVKGKGKAFAPPFHPPAPILNDSETPHLPSPAADPADTLPPNDTSIRSRLRPRRASMSSSSAVNAGSTRRSARHPATPFTMNRGGSSSTRRGSRRKRNVVKTEVIEDRYEWTCPVPGCEQLHASVKVGGLWKMDPKRGAVAVYV
ncbi:hypothetical protein JB92DRAFT_2824582 [Gautieria morchelliformis]|nr:hypothetical protein JB92DRAFT_2824582 [Gautieria morchelliformis]